MWVRYPCVLSLSVMPLLMKTVTATLFKVVRKNPLYFAEMIYSIRARAGVIFVCRLDNLWSCSLIHVHVNTFVVHSLFFFSFIGKFIRHLFIVRFLVEGNLTPILNSVFFSVNFLFCFTSSVCVNLFHFSLFCFFRR